MISKDMFFLKETDNWDTIRNVLPERITAAILRSISPDGLLEIALDLGRPAHKIGRASCRERV